MEYSPRKKSCKTLNFNDLIKEINFIDNINKIEEIYNYCKRENENNINSKLLNDLFRVCDEFIKNKNYIAVKRLLDSAENNLNNKTDRINFLKIKGELLFYSGDIEGSKNVYKRIFDENYYNNIDEDWKIAIKLLNIYLTNDLYEEFLELQNKLDKNSLLYTIFDLNYKINNNNFNIEYENDLIGNNEQKEIAYRLYSVFANENKDYVKRDEYLKRANNVKDNNIQCKILEIEYLLQDILNLKNEDKIFDNIRKLNKKIDDINLDKKSLKDIDKLRLKFSKLQPKISLMIQISDIQIDKDINELFELIFDSYFDRNIENILIYLLSNIAISKDELDRVYSYLYDRKYLIKPSQKLIELIAIQLFNVNIDNFYNFCQENNLNKFLDIEKNLRNSNIEESYNLLKEFDCRKIINFVLSIKDKELKFNLIEKFKNEYNSDNKEYMLNIFLYHQVSYSIDKNDVELTKKLSDYFLKKSNEKITISLCNKLCEFFYKNKAYTNCIEMLEYENENFEISSDERFRVLSYITICNFLNKNFERVCQITDKYIKNLNNIYNNKHNYIINSLIYVLISNFENYRDKFNKIVYDNYKLLKNIIGRYEYWLFVLLHTNRISEFIDSTIEFFKNRENLKNISNYFDLFYGIDKQKEIKFNLDNIEYNSYFILEGMENTVYFIGNKDKSFDVDDIIYIEDQNNICIDNKVGMPIKYPINGTDIFTNAHRKIKEIFTPFGCLHYIFWQKWQKNAAQNGIKIEISNEIEFLDKLKHLNGKFNQPYLNLIKNFYHQIPSLSIFLLFFKNNIKSLIELLVETDNYIYNNLDDFNKVYNKSLSILKRDSTINLCGTSLLFLLIGGVLDNVLEYFQNINISIDSLKIIYDIRKNIEENGESLAFVKNEIIYNRKKQEEVKNELLKNINKYIDILKNKTVLKVDDINKEKNEKFVPNFMLDVIKNNKKNSIFITEDCFLSTNLFKITNSFSSIFLIKLLAEKKIIKWKDYFEYYNLLVQSNCKHIIFNDIDIMNCIYYYDSHQIQKFTPEKIELLNIQKVFDIEHKLYFLKIFSKFFYKMLDIKYSTNEFKIILSHIFEYLPPNLNYESIILTFLREIDCNILNSNAYSEKILELSQYCRFQKYKELLIK